VTSSKSRLTRRPYLANVRREFEQRHRLMVIAGASGVGKTSFCCQFPKPLLVIQERNETGVEDLIQNASVDSTGITVGDPIEDWLHLLSVCSELESTPDHGYATILFEAITGFEQMLWEYAIEVDWRSNRADFMSFSKGPKAVAKSYWRQQFISALGRIRSNGAHVLLTAHSRVKPKDNPEGTDYTGEVAYCDAETWQQTHGAMEAVGVMVLQPVESERSDHRKAKIETDGQLMLYMHKTPKYDAKNRWGISIPIPLSGGPQESYLLWCKACGLDPATCFFK